VVVWAGGLIFIVENKCKADCSSSPRLVPFSIPPCRPAGGLHHDLVQEQIYLSVQPAGVCVQGRFVRPTSTDRLLARRGVRKSPRTHFAAFNSIFLLDQYHILPNKITKSQCLMGPAGVFVQGRFVRPTPADPLLQRKGGSSVSSHSGASG